MFSQHIERPGEQLPIATDITFFIIQIKHPSSLPTAQCHYVDYVQLRRW